MAQTPVCLEEAFLGPPGPSRRPLRLCRMKFRQQVQKEYRTRGFVKRFIFQVSMDQETAKDLLYRQNEGGKWNERELKT